MKASELRIGNFISSCFPISVVIGIDDEGVIDTAYYEHGKGVDYTSEWHSNEGSINPIPLTEEWLVKLGYSDTNDEMYNGNIWMLGDDIHVSPVVSSTGIHGLLIYGYLKYFEYVYVHQLQNLYHSLTGEELTTK